MGDFMEVAIKYEKIDLGEDRYVFKPVCVIKGKYDEENECFDTDYGDSCVPIDGNSIFDDNFFGECVSIDKLKEEYVGISEEEMLCKYFEESKLSYSLAYYDYVIGRIRVLHVPYDMVDEILDKVDSEEELEDGIAEQTSRSIGVTIDFEKIKEMRSIDDIKKIHQILDKIIEATNKILDGKKELEPHKEEKEVPKLALKKEDSKQITLKELRREVKSVIKGQDKAVNDVTRAVIVNQGSTNPRHKSHILITGPSGTGKTEIVNLIAKRMGVPYFKADATAYTKEGYVGKSVYSMFSGLVQAANGDIEKAQNGILVIDEIDKKLSPRKDDVGGIDVLNSLLKIMDRDVIEIEEGHGFQERKYLFDTSNLTIIFMGAFADLYASKQKEQSKFMGFSSSEDKKEKENKIVITNEDLIKAGMPPEFLGRIPVVTNTEEISLETLVEILYKSKGGAIDEEKEYFKGLGINIKFTSQYMREIATRAHQAKTGARDLRKLVRQSLATVYDDVLSGKKIKELKLTKKTVYNPNCYYAK